MKITRSNYESWFMDYLEGNLDASLSDEFALFLKQNPDLAEELKMGDLITLMSDKTIRFESKDELKKTISDAEIEFQERAIAYYEGDLSLSERINFEAWLSENPQNRKDAEQFGQLKLIADPKIIFANKDQLKRKGKVLPIWIKVAAAAAILLFVYLLFPPDSGVQPKIGNMVAIVKEQTPKNATVSDLKKPVEEKKIENSPSVSGPKRIPGSVPAKHKQNKAETVKQAEPEQPLRTPEPETPLLKPHGISFGQPINTNLAAIRLSDTIDAHEELQLSELLKVQLAEIRNSDDREFLSTEHLGLAGLQLFAKLTGKRLTARKGDDGVVKSVSYNSKILAFSIPVNR